MIWTRAGLERVGMTAPPALRLGVCVGSAGEAVAVEVGGSRRRPTVERVERWAIGLPENGAWPALTAQLSAVREAHGGAPAELTLALERPLAHVKLLSLPRLRASDARLLLERSADTFFPRTGPGPVTAGVRRVGRLRLAWPVSRWGRAPAHVMAAVAPAELVLATETAAREAGFRLAAVVPAGPAAAGGAIRLPPMHVADWWVVLVSEGVEAVQVAGGHVVKLRSAPWSQAGATPPLPVIERLLGDASGRVLLAGPGALAPALGRDLALRGASVDLAPDGLDGRGLAAFGAAAGRGEAPLVLTQAQIAGRRRRSRALAGAVALGASLLVILAAAGELALLRHRLAALERERAAIHSAVARARRIRSRIDALNSRATAVARLEWERSGVVRLIGNLTDALPEDAYILSLRLEKGELRFDGWSGSAVALVPVFEQEPWVKAVRLGGAVQREQSADGVQERFSMAVALGDRGSP